MIGKRHLLWLGRAFVFVFLTSSVSFQPQRLFQPWKFFFNLMLFGGFCVRSLDLDVGPACSYIFFLVIPALFHKVFSQIRCFCCLPVLGRFLCPESGWN